ncbi:MAG TPA: AAA family ATPase [Firmicutes bacterium]|nr:AAA family ATPase [Bacillota bacterium]
MIKEIGAGLALGLMAGLFIMGFNVYPLLLLVGLFFLLTRVVDIKGSVRQFVPISNSKAKGGISFDDIGGQNSAKRELLEALDFLRIPEKISSLGIRPLKGILLVGPPGTGKTLLAKAAAYYTDSLFLSAAGSEFIEMYAGVGAQRIRQLFKQARSGGKSSNKKSAIIFIDEIDILGARRGSGSNSHLEHEQTLNQLLVEMDGLGVGDETRVLLIGATNRADLLDSALLRPGRFDRIVQVDLPDQEGRLQILRLHTRNKPLAADVQLKNIAKETFGFSGAHLESLANEAAIVALREKKKLLENKHFSEAIDKVIMGEKIDRKPGREEFFRIAIHETGHAIVSECIRSCSVSTITIIPRGKAMGYIRQTPAEDSYISTRSNIEEQIAILLGGAISEEEILGNRSTGATADFQQAIELAKKIVSAGMSSLGIVSTDDLPNGVLHKNLKEILDGQEKRVRDIILKYRGIIENVANYLLEKEKISGACLRNILEKYEQKKQQKVC